MVKPRPPGKLMVVFHAEIVDPAALLRQDRYLAERRIEEAHQRLRQCIEAYRGRIDEVRDDEVLATFRRPAEAVVAGLAFQSAQKEVNRHIHDDIRAEARIGIAFGEALVDDGSLTGAGVVLSQRLEQLGMPGAVLTHGAVYDALPERLPFEYRDLGECHFKDQGKPAHCYRVALRDGESLPSPHRMALSRYLAVATGIAVVIAIVVLLAM